MSDKIQTACDYICQWPDRDPRIVTVVSLERDGTWARIIWREDLAAPEDSTLIGQADCVPVDWLHDDWTPYWVYDLGGRWFAFSPDDDEWGPFDTRDHARRHLLTAKIE